jgi:hypothetical protein
MLYDAMARHGRVILRLRPYSVGGSSGRPFPLHWGAPGSTSTSANTGAVGGPSARARGLQASLRTRGPPLWDKRAGVFFKQVAWGTGTVQWHLRSCSLRRLRRVYRRRQGAQCRRRRTGAHRRWFDRIIAYGRKWRSAVAAGLHAVGPDPPDEHEMVAK